MRIIFFGSSNFAVPSLEALKDNVVLVVTQIDRKKGRHLHCEATPIKKEAGSLGLQIYQPLNVNTKDSLEYIKEFSADLFCVVSFGQILSKELLTIPKKFAINLHGSLLPKYRGAAPINWAVTNGEEKTGVSVIRMNEKMDEGDIILGESLEIKDDDAIILSEKLSKIGAKLIKKSLELVKEGSANFIKQDEKEATYAPKLKKEDGLLNWELPNSSLHNKVRGLVPWPGSFTYYDGKMLKIWQVSLDIDNKYEDFSPGEILDVTNKGIFVGTGKGVLVLHEVQLEGKKRMMVDEFLRGFREIKKGEKFSVA